jgi:hypothetical protein
VRDFTQVVTVAQAPIWECAVAGGSDTSSETAPDPAKIAKMDWGPLGYTLLYTWHPATITAYFDVAVSGYRMDNRITQEMKYGRLPHWVQTYSDYNETVRYPDNLKVAYSAWYLAYQRIPKDDIQATRKGTGVYAMQGFRCAIHMRDFPAARKYWALAINTNPESAAAYAQIALSSFFQSIFSGARQNGADSSTDYLNIPQDMRDAAWNFTKGTYAGEDGNFLSKYLSMKQIEDAVQARDLNKLLRQRIPLLSIRYCPIFYPDFDTDPDHVSFLYSTHKVNFSIPSPLLKAAAERANQGAKAGKN